jgi:glycine/D-amino acid oxidase-like deaminating enzyme
MSAAWNREGKPDTVAVIILRKRIVICGGGAIGAAVAYFASRRGALPIVIERHEVAGAASGKSGGFLALDWCSGSPLDRLAELRAPCRAFLRARRTLGISAFDDLQRLRREGRCRARSARATVAGRRGHDRGPARHGLSRPRWSIPARSRQV